MLDPAFVRDNLETVRAGYANRGLDPTAELEQLAGFEAHRRRLIPRARGAEARAEHRRRTRWRGPSARASTPRTIFEANKARGQQIKQLEIELDGIESQRARGC